MSARAVAPAQSEVTVALLGRPNAGKSSLYNAITGGDAKVGNFPGITVDVLESVVEIPGGGRARFLDLPGVYSLGDEVDRDSDEGQARACLEKLEERNDAFVVAQVIDATQLPLALRLTKEILARDVPAMIVVTQRDVLEREGGKLDTSVLERALSVPVVAVSARDADVRARVLETVTRARAARTKPTAPFDPSDLADRAITRTRKANRTARADAILLHPIFGPLIFLVIMTALFSAVFLVADPATNAISAVLARVSKGVTSSFGVHWWTSLLCDGILGGAGTVLAFLPQIVILTIALEIIDASGYLARGAFLVDRVLRLAGLGGKSFVPLLTAHACAVPAIAATRIVRDPKQRLRTLLVLPLMTCSARIPTYGLLIAAFFRHRSAVFQAAVFVCLYSAGILAGFFASIVMGRMLETRRSGRSLPLVLEMPAYRVPQARVVARMAWRSCVRFLREVGTVIVLASMVLWLLLKIPTPGAPNDGTHNIASSIGHALEPATKPLGFDWRIDVGLIGSFGARELMVSTLGVTYGVEQDSKDRAPLAERIGSDPAYSTATALALMAFFVLACQCMSTVAALRRETKGWRVPVFVVAYTYAAAYVAALVTFQIARLV
jgi:ferrous iron transport protein B